MMIEPPIDEMAKMMDNNKYKLTCVMTKRAKELEKKVGSELETSEEKIVSLAAREIYEGKVVSSDQKK